MTFDMNLTMCVDLPLDLTYSACTQPRSRSGMAVENLYINLSLDRTIIDFVPVHKQAMNSHSGRHVKRCLRGVNVDLSILLLNYGSASY